MGVFIHFFYFSVAFVRAPAINPSATYWKEEVTKKRQETEEMQNKQEASAKVRDHGNLQNLQMEQPTLPMR